MTNYARNAPDLFTINSVAIAISYNKAEISRQN